VNGRTFGASGWRSNQGNTLHVSDGFSVHHQESKTVHTASGICHTGSVAAELTFHLVPASK